MNIPPPCNKKIFEEGIPIFLTHTMSSIRTEEWVQKIALDSGQKVDWHMFAGRASILALGNLDKVRQAIVKNRDMHDKFLQEALQTYHKEIGSTHDASIIAGI